MRGFRRNTACPLQETACPPEKPAPPHLLLIQDIRPAMITEKLDNYNMQFKNATETDLVINMGHLCYDRSLKLLKVNILLT